MAKWQLTMSNSSRSTVDIQAIAGALAASVQQALQTQSISARSQEDSQDSAPQGRLEIHVSSPSLHDNLSTQH